MRIKNLSILSFGIFTITALHINAQGLRVDGANAQIVCNGSPEIVLSNMGYTNNRSNTMFTRATSRVSFVGNASSNIAGTNSTDFYNNTINKTGGAELDVTSNTVTLTTYNTLTMTSGNVDMNSNLGSTWALGSSTANLGTLSRTTGHFYNGYFKRWYPTGAGTNTAAWDIPVGRNATNYNYCRIYHDNATSGGTLKVRFANTNPFYTGLPLSDGTNPGGCGTILLNNCSNEGYWQVTAADGIDATSNYTVKLNYSGFTAPTSEACLRVIKSENQTSWMQEGTHDTYDGAADWVSRSAQTGFSFFTVAGNSTLNPLPVELTTFDANCAASTTLINWNTVSENGNSHFILERSKNSINWDFVSIVNSLSQNGNSNNTLQYAYEDETFGGTFYYRITQVDLNGALETYSPVSVTCGGENDGEPVIVNTFRPTDNQISIVLFAPGIRDYVMSLYDMHGKKISATTGMLVSGNNTINLDANSLRDAYYIVSVQIGDKNLSKKVLVK